ncbi:MAG TPA: hypothetical protein VH206_17450 [Xanthobacteraceae bacterium]|jgi:hypothetical protein|nr:hypothetical protein [Xanthobacteraceae bacterium]
MTTRLSVTITTPSSIGQHGGTRRAECVELADLLGRLAQQLGSTQATSGTINDRNGNGLLTYTYTPTASS